MTDNLSSTTKHFGIAPLQTNDGASLEKIHDTCFIPAWKKQTFDSFLADRFIFGYKAYLIKDPSQILGFCLCNLIHDEAEIITIAVHTHFRRQRIGYSLIHNVLQHLYRERATKLFLEVDETNLSALALYQHFEFQKIARRAAYYQAQNTRTDAIIMQKTFMYVD